jgi:hypothetical protein
MPGRKSSIHERLNAVQDELDRFFPTCGASITDECEMDNFDFPDSLIQLLNPQLEATERALNVLLGKMKADEGLRQNLLPLDVESITQTIFEAKKYAYFIGVIVGLRMMEASRESINDLLFDPKKSLEPGKIRQERDR